MVGWSVCKGMPVAFFLEGGNVESTVGFQTRREVMRQMVPRYQKASSSQKEPCLTRFPRQLAMLVGMQCAAQSCRGGAANASTSATTNVRTRGSTCSVFRVATRQSDLYKTAHAVSRDSPRSVGAAWTSHLTNSCRMQLLSMSAATADRLLRGPRTHGQRGLATTRAGTLLKQQIAIRTFEQWNETQPGFLEADLVAHCGSHLNGSYLYTLTLTDIATQWTECLPLRTRSAEAVVSALQQARMFFPFPILGVDTDNGCEFINERLLVYCDTQQITFTRGREGIKNDQNFVEQMNGSSASFVLRLQPSFVKKEEKIFNRPI